MKKQKLSTKILLFYVAYTAMVVLSGNVFDGQFAFGSFVGALYVGNPLLVSLIYIASSVTFGLSSLLQCGIKTCVVLACWAIHYFTKRKIGKFNLLLYVMLANVFYLVYGFVDYGNLLNKILYATCGVAFAFVSLYVFRAVFVRGLNYPPQTGERICIAIFGIVAIFCLSKLTFATLEVVYFALPFTLLFANSCFDEKTTWTASVVCGLGNLLATGSLQGMAFCVLSALAIVTFGTISRYLSAIGVVVVDVVLSYFLGLHGSFYALFFAPTLTSTLIFVVIPTSVYKKLNDSFCGSVTRFATQSLSSKLTQDLTRRLFRLSDIFMAIKNAFYTLSVGNVSREQVMGSMVKQCSQTVCQSCQNRAYCWRQHLTVTEKALLQLSQVALTNGKCTILDIPQTISAKCERVSMLISQINDVANTHKQFVEQSQDRLNCKLLVADQMAGVSNLLLQLATDYKSNVTFDLSCQRDIKESLIFHNVMCSDVTVVTQGGMLLIVATVAKDDLDEHIIEQCAEIVLKQPMAVQKEELTQNSRWVNVYLGVKPRFSLSFGVATIAKSGSEISADTHGQITTDNGKSIVTLCDGMGSGQKAEQMSTTVIQLVESFYRAGFDSDTILSAVNGLLTQSGNEIFCAVDMVIVDLYNGFADFVKLGAPVGFVKCENVVEMIRGSSLPLGVLEEMKPSITKKALRSGDIILLVSDGVADCYKDATVFAEIFHNVTYTAPQSIAETLLAKTLKQCNNTPPDDMTVIVAKVV